MTPNPVRWFEIYVQDMDRAKAFYEAVLGTRLERLDGDLEMVRDRFPQPRCHDAGRPENGYSWSADASCVHLRYRAPQ